MNNEAILTLAAALQDTRNERWPSEGRKASQSRSLSSRISEHLLPITFICLYDNLILLGMTVEKATARQCECLVTVRNRPQFISSFKIATIRNCNKSVSRSTFRRTKYCTSVFPLLLPQRHHLLLSFLLLDVHANVSLACLYRVVSTGYINLREIALEFPALVLQFKYRGS